MSFRLLPFFGSKIPFSNKMTHGTPTSQDETQWLVWGEGVPILGSCPDVSQRDVTLVRGGVRMRSEEC